ncbi:MAG: molybdopterin-dependent oxidoreductase, partial [bacterium]|nr:molybdopterin-dependent oxidoreductase [bacterium]
AELVGREYFGRFVVNWTTSHEVKGEVISHFSYGYACNLVVMDETGRIQTIHAAHDGGKIINPKLFEGQVEGGVVMGMGYAMTENFPLKDGRLTSDRMSKLGLPKAAQVPEIKVYSVECKDPMGPFGAKGVGEIGTIPTAPAIANAFRDYDGKCRFSLPLEPVTPKK